MKKTVTVKELQHALDLISQKKGEDFELEYVSERDENSFLPIMKIVLPLMVD